MARSARPIQYIGSSLPTPSRATTGRRPLPPRTTTQVRLVKQLLDKQTGALLVLPQIRGSVSRVGHGIPRVSSDGIMALTPVFLQRLRCGTSHGGSFGSALRSDFTRNRGILRRGGAIQRRPGS